MQDNPAYPNPKEQVVLQDNPAYSGVVNEHIKLQENPCQHMEVSQKTENMIRNLL